MESHFTLNVDELEYDPVMYDEYQDARKHLRVGEKIKLIHFPTKVNKNSVMVARARDDEVIGWLRKSSANVITPMLDSGKTIDSFVYVVESRQASDGKTVLECKIEIKDDNIISEYERAIKELYPR